MAVPTTAGTGSETTLAAVITDAQTRYKYAINDFPLIPRYAVLDPKVTLSLPPFITATTGMDALTHAVEAYIGNSTTYGTRKDALLAVMQEKNITQYKLMKETNFKGGNIYTWFNKNATPRLDTVVELANFFDVTLDHLVGRE